jgi:hypothetical protein
VNQSVLKNPAFLAALGVMASAAIGMSTAIHAMRIHLSKKPIYPASGLTLSALPSETENWRRQGPDRIESAEVVEQLGTRNYVSRLYVEKDPPQGSPPRVIDFHAAYYTGMIDTVPHVPDRCFIGGGMRFGGSAPRTIPLELDDSSWMPVQDVPEQWAGRVFTVRPSSRYGLTRGTRVTLPRDPHDIRMRVMEFVDDRTGQRIFAGYFFIANGGAVPRAEGVRRLAFNLTDDYAYYLKVQFVSYDARSPEELADKASDLLSDIIGDLMYLVPDWVQVEKGLWPEDNPRRGR